jgi:hypothetical protein
MFYPELCKVCSKKFDEAIEKAKPYALLYTDFSELLCLPCKLDTQSKKEVSKTQETKDEKESPQNVVAVRR